MDCPAVKNKLKKIASGYEPESVASFDVATGLPLLKKALYEATWEDYPNPFNTGIQRDMVWTMLHLSLAIGARASLLTDFCPMIDQLDFPGKDERCTDGKPMFFKLKLYRWKHNPGRRQQELIVRRNFANPEFCPVLTMLHWLDTLKANGIENGPLFPALNKAHDDFLREEIDGVMHLQRMLELAGDDPTSKPIVQKLVKPGRKKACKASAAAVAQTPVPTETRSSR